MGSAAGGDTGSGRSDRHRHPGSTGEPGDGDGEDHAGGDSMTYQTLNPYTEKLESRFEDHTDAQLEEILAKAQTAFETDWSVRPLAARKAIVKKAAAILREKIDEFAKPITIEMGKLFNESKE